MIHTGVVLTGIGATPWAITHFLLLFVLSLVLLIFGNMIYLIAGD